MQNNDNYYQDLQVKVEDTRLYKMHIIYIGR